MPTQRHDTRTGFSFYKEIRDSLFKKKLRYSPLKMTMVTLQFYFSEPETFEHLGHVVTDSNVDISYDLNHYNLHMLGHAFKNRRTGETIFVTSPCADSEKLQTMQTVTQILTQLKASEQQPLVLQNQNNPSETLKLSDIDQVLIPHAQCLHGRNHWVTLQVLPKESKAVYFDPKGKSLIPKWLRTVFKLILGYQLDYPVDAVKKEMGNNYEVTYHQQDLQRRGDGINCGPFSARTIYRLGALGAHGKDELGNMPDDFGLAADFREKDVEACRQFNSENLSQNQEFHATSESVLKSLNSGF